MKFKCGCETDDERHARVRAEHKAWLNYITNWHPHFFLWPRAMGKGECLWLQWGQRRRVGLNWHTWEYKE